MGVTLDARIVAPAIELMAPRLAMVAAANLTRAATGVAATASSATAARRAAGERCKSVIRVSVDRFIQA